MTIETCAIMWGDRHFPAGVIADQCRALEQSGAVDGILFADQLANFVPNQLWTPEHTPMADVIADPDSHSDAFILAAYAHTAAPSLKLHVTTDSVRRPPAELTQAMLTLCAIAGGPVNLQVGGGEAKQTRPYGHPTNQGMSRMKDLFEIYTKFMANDGPFDHDGRRWTFRRATLGGAMPHRPELWGLGAGPQLVDLATSYADGLGVTVPMAWTSPEMCAEKIAEIRGQVAAKGRDPEAFRFGLWGSVLLHEDEAYLDAALENPIMKWMSGCFGRIETRLWKDEGLELPFPDGWTYYKDLVPYDMDDALVDAIVGAVTREHHEKGWWMGSPTAVAEQVQPYLDAGFDWFMPLDYLPLVADLDEAQRAFGRIIEVCAAVKANNSAGA